MNRTMYELAERLVELDEQADTLVSELMKVRKEIYDIQKEINNRFPNNGTIIEYKYKEKVRSRKK